MVDFEVHTESLSWPYSWLSAETSIAIAAESGDSFCIDSYNPISIVPGTWRKYWVVWHKDNPDKKVRTLWGSVAEFLAICETAAIAKGKEDSWATIDRFPNEIRPVLLNEEGSGFMVHNCSPWVVMERSEREFLSVGSHKEDGWTTIVDMENTEERKVGTDGDQGSEDL